MDNISHRLFLIFSEYERLKCQRGKIWPILTGSVVGSKEIRWEIPDISLKISLFSPDLVRISKFEKFGPTLWYFGAESSRQLAC